MNSNKTEIFCLSLQPATPWQLPWARRLVVRIADTTKVRLQIALAEYWLGVTILTEYPVSVYNTINNDLTGPEYKVGVLGTVDFSENWP